MTREMELRARAAAPAAMQAGVNLALLHMLWLLSGLVLMILLAIDLGLAPERLFAGVEKIGRFARAMVPPSDGGDLARILRSLAETFAMAVAGTVLAVLGAIPLGLLGAKTVAPQPAFHFLLRRFLDIFRGVPVLVWALILVTVFGLGPFAGVVALALADIPSLSKLFAEALENIDQRPVEGVRAAGGSPLAVIRYATAPQVAPVWTSQCLFFLEGNFRNAAVLGIVGAGGIGYELEERIRVFSFDEAAFIILLYMAAVAALDGVSWLLRKRLA
jgi:phosphonate transport system permease protein